MTFWGVERIVYYKKLINVRFYWHILKTFSLSEKVLKHNIHDTKREEKIDL